MDTRLIESMIAELRSDGSAELDLRDLLAAVAESQGVPASEEDLKGGARFIIAYFEQVPYMMKVAWTAAEGMKLNPADASTIKVFGTEFFLDAFRLMMEVMGERGALRPDAAPGELVANGMVETLYRSLLILTFGGGTNEIQRDLIGLFGLGLPRVPRF